MIPRASSCTPIILVVRRVPSYGLYDGVVSVWIPHDGRSRDVHIMGEATAQDVYEGLIKAAYSAIYPYEGPTG